MSGRAGALILTGLMGLLGGCAGRTADVLREVAGIPREEPPGARAGEARWVLIRNPRFGATMGEPEFIWVRDDRIPGSLTTALFGRSAVVAPEHLVARYGPPPGNGALSPLQGGAVVPVVPAVTPGAPRQLLQPPGSGETSGAPAPAGSPEVAARPPEPLRRGWVVHVQAGLVVVDLTAADGIRPGSRLSIRRGGVTLVHPVTRERLGELREEEVATARVVEVRDRYSVAELEASQPGLEPRIRDRVVVTEP